MSRKYHPDRNPDDPEALANFQKLNHIHNVLSEPSKRSHYDRFGEEDLDEVDSGSEPEAEEGSGEDEKEMDEKSFKDLLNKFKENRSASS